MALPREPVLVVELPQMLCERVRVHQLPALIGEQVLAERYPVHGRLLLFLVPVRLDQAHDIVADVDRPGLPVFRAYPEIRDEQE